MSPVMGHKTITRCGICGTGLRRLRDITACPRCDYTALMPAVRAEEAARARRPTASWSIVDLDDPCEGGDPR